MVLKCFRDGKESIIELKTLDSLRAIDFFKDLKHTYIGFSGTQNLCFIYDKATKILNDKALKYIMKKIKEVYLLSVFEDFDAQDILKSFRAIAKTELLGNVIVADDYEEYIKFIMPFMNCNKCKGDLILYEAGNWHCDKCNCDYEFSGELELKKEMTSRIGLGKEYYTLKDEEEIEEENMPMDYPSAISFSIHGENNSDDYRNAMRNIFGFINEMLMPRNDSKDKKAKKSPKKKIKHH